MARERYNCVQLCILSVYSHWIRNLQQAEQPRTPIIAHAQYGSKPNTPPGRIYYTSLVKLCHTGLLFTKKTAEDVL